MKFPPMVVYMKVGANQDEQNSGFCLWIPLFILVPIALIMLLALLLIALPFLLISVLITWDVKWLRWVMFSIQAFFKTTHELTGLKLDIEDGKQKIYIDVQ
jgi:hypothetical protein